MSRRTQDPAGLHSDFGYGTCTLYGHAFNRVLLSSFLPCRGPTTPVQGPVWAAPLSLAATRGITLVFFSSGYLDVSVPRVPLHDLCIQSRMTADDGCRVPPFGHRRVVASLQLADAFRSLARPSSLWSGQASSVRPSLLNQWFSSFFLLSRVFTRCFIKNCFFTVFSVLSSTFV